MIIDYSNITSHEFIGLDTEVVRSTNPQLVGLNGRIINETKSMFQINTHKGVKSVPKAQNNWKFTINGQNLIVEGLKIAKRPYDRIGATKV